MPDLTPEQRAHRAAAAARARLTGDVAPMVHGRTTSSSTDAALSLYARGGLIPVQSEPTTNGTDDERDTGHPRA